MFTIVDMSTKRIVRRAGDVSFVSERGAKISAAKLNKCSTAPVRRYVVMSKESFDKYLNPMVERVNILTGQKFMELRATPNFCSPAYESYWST